MKALRTGEAIVSQGAPLSLLGMVAEDNGRFPVSDFGGFGFGERAFIGGMEVFLW